MVLYEYYSAAFFFLAKQRACVFLCMIMVSARGRAWKKVISESVGLGFSVQTVPPREIRAGRGPWDHLERYRWVVVMEIAVDGYIGRSRLEDHL